MSPTSATNAKKRRVAHLRTVGRGAKEPTSHGQYRIVCKNPKISSAFRRISASRRSHEESGHAACWLSRRPANYIQRRAIRYRPQTSAKATIAQSTATNQKGIALRPLPLALPSGFLQVQKVVTQEGHVRNMRVSSLVNGSIGSYAPGFGYPRFLDLRVDGVLGSRGHRPHRSL